MFCFLPINTLALGTLPPGELKNASGLYNLMRNLGGAIGLAALNTVLIDQAALHTSRLGESVTAARPVVQGFLDSVTERYTALGVPDPDMAALRTLSNMVERQSLVITFNDTLLLMAAVFFAALLLMPLIRKPKVVAAEAH
jgi:DHA2 family multidrug resistance protein